jgi:hypothetical protein
MQPLAEVTLTRPWHWGITALGVPLADVPTQFADGKAVALGRDVVAFRVRHAQDIEPDRLEGDWDWATATIHLRSLVREEPTERPLPSSLSRWVTGMVAARGTRTIARKVG